MSDISIPEDIQQTLARTILGVSAQRYLEGELQ